MKKSLWWLLALVLVVMLVLPAGLMGCKTADAVEETVAAAAEEDEAEDVDEEDVEDEENNNEDDKDEDNSEEEDEGKYFSR